MIKILLEKEIKDFKWLNGIAVDKEIDDEIVWMILEDHQDFQKMYEKAKYIKNRGLERLSAVFDKTHSIIAGVDNIVVHCLYESWRSEIGCVDYWTPYGQLLIKQHPFRGYWED